MIQITFMVGVLLVLIPECTMAAGHSPILLCKPERTIHGDYCMRGYNNQYIVVNSLIWKQVEKCRVKLVRSFTD